MIADDKLKAWREAAERAKPGPWQSSTCFGDCCMTPNDSVFIASAREAVPALLDEVERLSERLDTLYAFRLRCLWCGEQTGRFLVGDHAAQEAAETDLKEHVLRCPSRAPSTADAGLVAERDRLAAENERLRTEVARMRPVFDAAQRVIDDAQPSLDALVGALLEWVDSL